MRTIKFRAKVKMPEKRNFARQEYVPEGQWVYGEPHTIDCPTPHIHTVDVGKQPIDKETICQFTGMFCEGKEIYEGDIIHCAIGHSPNIFEITGVVEYHTCAFVMHYKHHNQDAYTWLDALIGADIIGNIHDNPELMKGGAQ